MIRTIYSLALAASVSAASLAHAENVTIRIGGPHPAALTYVQGWDEYFEEELTKRAAELGHRVRLIEAWGTVASVSNVVETVSSGALDIGLAIPIFEPSTLEIYNFGNTMPFTSPDPELQARVIQRMFADLPILRDGLADYGVTVLGMSAGENYGMALRDAPSRPEDIAGMRIASGAVNAPWTAAMGGIPVPLAVNENYQAMQSGLIDGSLFFISGMEVFRFREVLDAYYITDFGSLPGIVFVMNNETREELPDDLVQLIDELALETSAVVGRLSRERDEYFHDLIADDVEIVQITPEDQMRWAEVLRPDIEAMVDEMENRGLPAKDIYGTYVRALAAEGHSFPVDYSFE